jgi:hypothetical protein
MVMTALFIVCVVVITILSITIVGLNKQIETLERCDDVVTNCPVCGDDVAISTTPNAFYIKCDGCYLYTGGYDSKSELIEAWEKISK